MSSQYQISPRDLFRYCPRSAARAADRSSGVISFDLIGNQTNGLGKQKQSGKKKKKNWAKPLKRMMDGLHFCLWLNDAAASCSFKTLSQKE